MSTYHLNGTNGLLAQCAGFEGMKERKNQYNACVFPPLLLLLCSGVGAIVTKAFDGSS